MIAIATVVSTVPAWAGGDWGTTSEAKVCAELSKWSSPECQAEIAKRTQACLEDGDMQMDLGVTGYTPKTPNDAGKELCKKEASKEIQKQLAAASRENVATAKAAKAEQSALQSRELPKAVGRAPAIEQMVTASFRKSYPDKKFLKVVLDQKPNWENQRSAAGVLVSRSVWATVASRKGDKCEIYGTYWEQQHNGKGFAGSLVEHGAGAAAANEILCAKVK